MTYEFITYEAVAPHVVQVTLNRPHVANALSVGLLTELSDAVQRISDDDDVHVWLLTGSPRPDGRPWFSAGVDMKEAASEDAPARFPGLALADRIDALLKPSIAVIGGVCTTGALELVLACDIRVAGRGAELSDFHMIRTGLGIGAWGLASRLSRLVGTDKAKEILLLSETISGEEAARIGLVNRTVGDDILLETALAMANRIAGMPRRGVRTTLGYLALQSEMSKHDAIRWAELAPEFMGVSLRPFSDAANRFFGQRETLPQEQ